MRSFNAYFKEKSAALICANFQIYNTVTAFIYPILRFNYAIPYKFTAPPAIWLPV